MIRLLLSGFSLKSLNSVLLVADTSNVARATEQLNCLQIAVSKAIQGVEQKICQPLFDLFPTGGSLTLVGEVLVHAPPCSHPSTPEYHHTSGAALVDRANKQQ